MASHNHHHNTYTVTTPALPPGSYSPGSTQSQSFDTANDLEKNVRVTTNATGPKLPHAVRGNPAPLGLLCFGMTTCMLMFTTTSWTSAGLNPLIISYAFFYGGAGQLIAGVLELIRGNTFAGTAFSSYGAFWLGWALWHYFEGVVKAVPAVGSTALTGDTLWLCLWGVFTLCFFVVTLRKNLCLQIVFLSLAITFFLLAGGNYSSKCKKAAGYVGFFCGSSAIYTAVIEVYQVELGWNLPGLHPTHFI